MPYRDLREFLELLMKRGELKVCKREVDRYIEIAKVTDKSSKVGGPAILFENVRGFETPVVTGVFGTLDRAFLTIDSNKYDGYRKLAKALGNPIPCKLVNDAPCKEVIKTRGEIDLNKIPVLWHHPKDSHHFIIATNCIVKDPDTGIRNNSIHRMAVIDKDKLGIFINVTMHLRVIIKKYLSRGLPCPIVIAVGTDPAVLCCASSKIPYDMDELEYTGGVRGEAVEMVGCEKIDLDVPATAELVIEGEIIPGDEEGYVGKSVYVDEGPFAEVTGYYGVQRRSPVVHVRAITHRKDFIYQGLGTAIPPTEHHMISCVMMHGDVFTRTKTVVPEENIRGIHLPQGGCNHTAIISIKKTHRGQAKQLIYSTLTSPVLKKIIVVDEDIDVFDPQEVEWAVTFRSRTEDYVMTTEMPNEVLDPMVTPPTFLVPKVGIDATLPLEGDKKGRTEILRDLGPARYPDLDKVNLADYIGQ